MPAQAAHPRDGKPPLRHHIDLRDKGHHAEVVAALLDLVALKLQYPGGEIVPPGVSRRPVCVPCQVTSRVTVVPAAWEFIIV